jgi:hypothetical protein
MKHTPATPLPWFCNGPDGRKGIRSDHEMTDEERAHYSEKFRREMLKGERIEGPISQDDYPYVAHAANAYPKLVDALREAYSINAKRSVDRAYALLRELGEE